MNRIRILHIVHTLATGGTEAGVRKLLAGLDPEVFEQIVCTITNTAAGAGDTHARVVTLGRGTTRTGFLVPDLVRMFRQEKPDIIHSRNWGTIEAIPAAKIAGVPVAIHSEHGRDLQTMGRQPWRRRIFRRACFGWANYVFAVSTELRSYYASELHINANRMGVLTNGVDTKRFRPNPALRQAMRAQLGVTPETIVMGTVSRLDPIKDHRTLLRALEVLLGHTPDLLLVIIGDGSERAGLQRDVDASPLLQRHVRFVGESDDVPAWLNSFDIFVLPSLSEGLSNTLLEAMAVGVAPVATSVGGNPEVVENERSGLLFPAGDHVALAARLQQLAGDPGRRQSLAFGARRRIESCFSLERMLANYAQMYGELVGHERVAQPAFSRA